MFINTLPLRVRLDDSPVVDWLQRIQKEQIAARDFEYSPLASVQRWSEISRGDTLLQTIVVFENYPETIVDGFESFGLSVEEFEYREQSNFPIALLIVPDEQLDVRIIHDRSQFSDEFACQILEQFEIWLDVITSNPIAALNRLPLPLDAASRHILRTVNDTAADFDDHQSIDSLIEQRASETPDAVAAVFQSQKMTYRELSDRSDKLAHSIRATGAVVNSHIGLFTQRSFDMIVGIVGILKSGGAYVPLDPTYPAKQLQRIADKANLTAIVASQTDSNRLPMGTWPTIHIDQDLSDQDRFLSKHKGDDTAYVIFTSGSSGQPKGVPISHRNLVNSTFARREFYRGTVERFLLLSSFSFDSSIAGIFWTLIDGGTLVLPPPKGEQDLQLVADLIAEHQVTHSLALPSLYDLLLKHSSLAKLSSLKTMIIAGEAASSALVVQHHESLPGAKLYNEYGPTEGTVWCTASELASVDTTDSVPIGRPISNSRVYVLDHQQRPVPIGVCGELHLAGSGLAAGYLDEAELTEAKFIENPFDDSQYRKIYRTGDLAYFRADGQLVYVGRIDQHVKVRGYRIELGEIENVLHQCPGVENVIVTTRTMAGEDELAAKLSRLTPVKAKELLRDLLTMTEEQLDEELGQSS